MVTIILAGFFFGRSIRMHREGRRSESFLLFLSGSFIIIFGLTIIPAILGLETVIDAMVAIGTMLLAFATFYYGSVEYFESRNNRRLERIQKQLDELYSPLIGVEANTFIRWNLHKTRGAYNIMMRIRAKYKYLASMELRELLDEYYKRIDSGKYVEEELLGQIWKQVVNDFEAFINEYNSLT